ncbi:MAG: type II CRISPR RNA-guided endonuclease Cas9, partial [Candidatus Cryptobacteroides sp.]
MKKILGLDLGTNSIGWAVVNFDQDENENEVFSGISNADSRVIPMDQATIGDFNRGNSKSQTAERTRCRGVRRLYERGHLRRERLNRVLAVMGWLPEHYRNSIDAYGKLLPGTEPKLAWRKADDGKYEFLFKDAFNEMLEEFRRTNPALLDDGKKVPYDWTLYYLRRKALSMPVSNLELAWILLSFNQKRGYYQLRGEDEESTSCKKEDYYSLRVLEINDTGEKKGDDKQFEIVLENGYKFRRFFKDVPDWAGKEKAFIITTDIDGDGNPKKDKQGQIKYSIRLPKDDDWTLLKKKTEKD